MILHFICFNWILIYICLKISIFLSPTEYWWSENVDRRCCTGRFKCYVKMFGYRKSSADSQMEEVNLHIQHHIRPNSNDFQRTCCSISRDDNNKISISKGISGRFLVLVSHILSYFIEKVSNLCNFGLYFPLPGFRKWQMRPCMARWFVWCGGKAVTEWEGEVLEIARISRLDMSAYLCIASNGVPPSVSKRIKVSVDCEYASCWWLIWLHSKHSIHPIQSAFFWLHERSDFTISHFLLVLHTCIYSFLQNSSANGMDSTTTSRYTRGLQCNIRVFHRSISNITELLVKGWQRYDTRFK